MNRMILAALGSLLILSACGGGGSGPPFVYTPDSGDIVEDTPPTDVVDDDTTPRVPDDDIPTGDRALLTTSSVGMPAVRVSDQGIAIGGRTVRFNAATQIDSGHYRAFDTPGAVSGSAIEVHYFGRDAGYSHVQFGSWAMGTVSPNPSFRIGDHYGAFLAPGAAFGRTPVSAMPRAGSATYEGSYAGYLERSGEVLSDRGVMMANAVFTPGLQPWLHVELHSLTIDPLIDRLHGTVSPTRSVALTGPIDGNGFRTDVQATRTVLGREFPRGDSIGILSGIGLGSPGIASANSGGMTGGFFGSTGGELAGVYEYTAGTTRAAGAFGGKLQ